VLRMAFDGVAGWLLRPTPPTFVMLLAAPAREVLMGVAWAHGLVRSTVVWRSNRFRVLPGPRLVALAGGANPAGAFARSFRSLKRRAWRSATRARSAPVLPKCDRARTSAGA